MKVTAYVLISSKMLPNLLYYQYVLTCGISVFSFLIVTGSCSNSEILDLPD